MTKTACLLTGFVCGLVAASFAFATSKLGSELDPAKLNPQMYKVLLDNEHVRVIDYHIKPGEKEPLHSHPSGVLAYYFTDAKTRGGPPDGPVTENSSKAGDVAWRDPVTHKAENVGTAEIHQLLVEPKETCKNQK